MIKSNYKGDDKMASLTSAINVQVDAEDKEKATNILKSLGLNMSTFINMAIKQVIKKDGIPFEVTNSKPNKELLEAIEEGDQIIKEIKSFKKKGYNNMTDLIKSLNDE